MNLAAPEAVSTTGTKLHRIVIVGGGAGGLELTTQLGDKLGRKGRAEITLVDHARTHIWKPLLHEIAAGSMDTGRHELPFQAQGHWHGFRYRYGEMIGIDRTNKRVHLAATHDEDEREITPDRCFSYDTLVIAIGSVSSDFGTPGVKEHAFMLDTPEQAEKFNGACSTPACAHTRKKVRCGRASCMLQSLEPVRRESSFRPNCIKRRAASSPSGLIKSIRKRTSRSR